MVRRIEVTSTVPDARADQMRRVIRDAGIEGVEGLRLVRAYTLNGDFNDQEATDIADSLTHPVSETSSVDGPVVSEDFAYAVEIAYAPGVTDNIGNTVSGNVRDITGRHLEGQVAYSSEMLLLAGKVDENTARSVGSLFSNPLIQTTRVKPISDYNKDGGMGIHVPRVVLRETPRVDLVDILNASDGELARIGKQGIANPDGSRRGPLALDMTYMTAIKKHFETLGRNPTDVELESIAQTWSEHCCHTILNDPIDDVKEGLFKRYIRRATETVMARRRDGFCVSVFKDNSGAIAFDDNWLITDKVETHNSPSALDPFGGAITGIVGVNRDALGCGRGAKPFANGYFFCLRDPDDKRTFYRGAGKTQPMLSSKRTMSGVIEGVKDGGNSSGIQTPQGGVYFDDSYVKPLVFVRTLGLMPRKEGGRVLHEKKANPGDLIVMLGGRVGKDGIHGATFSSESLNTGSPATAVQIGDPITQKTMSDALIREARPAALYTSITDNGAGGLSCSVAEMAREAGGCHVYLERVPLKYPGLHPWESWISESQERMTLAVPSEKWPALKSLMDSRGVEATVLGEFTDSGKCVVEYDGRKVMDLDMEFLHNGRPARPMKTAFTRRNHSSPNFDDPKDGTAVFLGMLGRKNIASTAFISRQYDHEVQGGSVIKPLQGRGLVNGDATVIRPLLDSHRGVVLSHGINPSYGDINPYNMAAAAIDTAVRNAIAAGASLEKLALLDNFCWCSSNDPERQAQLKMAAEACHDMAVGYNIPFISGKDSMFNDFNGFDEDGRPVKISAKPTLLASSIAIMDDTRKAVSLDAKMPGDIVYVVGRDRAQLGGSEYFAMMGERHGEQFTGNICPDVDRLANLGLYRALSKAIDQGIVASAKSVHLGGIGVALAKSAMGGRLGMEIDLNQLPGTMGREDNALYSESQGRFVVTVRPEYADRFEQAMSGRYASRVGVVQESLIFTIKGKGGRNVVQTDVNRMLRSYRATFEEY